MLREALNDGTRDHDKRSDHDGPSPTEALVEPGCKGHTEDGAELVARVDEAKQTWLNRIFFLAVVADDDAAIAKV